MTRLTFYKLCYVPIMVAALSANTLAHPGHPVEVVSPDSPLHYVAQPEHALALFLLAATMWMLSQAILRRHALSSIPCAKR